MGNMQSVPFNTLIFEIILELYMERTLYFCGDIHGELKNLVFEIIKIKYKIENADVLILGDFGVGFGGPNSMKVQYESVEKELNKRDVTIYTISGNHDDPAWFDGEHDFERLKFLPSHQIIELCGKKIYPIGGAISVDIDKKLPGDKRSRREENEYLKRVGSSKRVWWENEGCIQKMKDLPIRVDIIATHDAPLSFEPIVTRGDDVTYETWEKILDNRKYLDHVLYEVKCSRWFYGHYHTSYSGHIGDMLYRCLGINEIFEIRV